MSLYTTMRQFRLERPNVPAAKLAVEFLAENTGADLTRVLAEEFARLDRLAAHQVEMEERCDTEIQTRDERRLAWSERLRANSISIGDGAPRTFGKMTVAEHRIRVAMLAKQREGLTATIGLHEQAIADIESAGVTCLDELEASAA